MWNVVEQSDFRNHTIQLYVSVSLFNRAVEVFNSPGEDETILLLAYVTLSICYDIAVLVQFYNDNISNELKRSRHNDITDKYATDPGKECPIAGCKAEYVRRLHIAFAFHIFIKSCHDPSMWKVLVGVFTKEFEELYELCDNKLVKPFHVFYRYFNVENEVRISQKSAMSKKWCFFVSTCSSRLQRKWYWIASPSAHVCYIMWYNIELHVLRHSNFTKRFE